MTRAQRASPISWLALGVTMLASATLASAIMALSCHAEARDAAPAATATIDGRSVRLEVARSPSEQALGLGGRDELRWHHGMLFPYDEAGFYRFWMKRMRFDIDIVWIRDRRIVGISAFVPYPRENPDRPVTIRAPELVDTVLEVPAGYAQAHGWRRGDSVDFSGVGRR